MNEVNVRKVSDILREKSYNSRPLQTISEEYDRVRINFVTDDISKRSLFGGVATALILVTLLCEKNDWTLRIVTRCTECDLVDYYKFLEVQKLRKPKYVECYSDHEIAWNANINYCLPVSDKDVYFATSWWSAKSIIDSDVCKKFMYIIQEEETFFYPYGDERYECSRIMDNEDIDYIVNSNLLYTYLKNHNYQTLCGNALFFEPAFAKHLYYADGKTFSKEIGEKKKLFFYGRPHNPRNIYYFGLRCLDEALKRGIIDTNLWEVYLAGSEIDAIEFSNGYQPKMNGVMGWNEYAEFARTVDLAFCLMYTPHPSYPPFDMLTSGAVVLTNNFENKRDLSYSDNMVMSDLEIESMMIQFEKAIKLAENTEERKRNYQNNNILTDWEIAFKDVIPELEKRIKEGRYV